MSLVAQHLEDAPALIPLIMFDAVLDGDHARFDDLVDPLESDELCACTVDLLMHTSDLSHDPHLFVAELRLETMRYPARPAIHRAMEALIDAVSDAYCEPADAGTRLAYVTLPSGADDRATAVHATCILVYTAVCLLTPLRDEQDRGGDPTTQDFIAGWRSTAAMIAGRVRATAAVA